MLRNLMFGAAALALAAFASPAGAQLAPGDVEIEGPMSSITVDNSPIQLAAGGTRNKIGTIQVMGVKVFVAPNALVHTPTNVSTDPTSALTLFEGFAAGSFHERGEQGFVKGTGIIVGESIKYLDPDDNNKVKSGVYATDVFSDMFEHVAVGEATGAVRVSGSLVSQVSVNGMAIKRSTDWRMPASPPINGFGLRIRPGSIQDGTLISAEGVYIEEQNTLWYHTLEADSAELVRPEAIQIGILRADCRIRGGGRDEIEVRGGVANWNGGNIVISYSNPTTANPNRFTQILQPVTATPDATNSNMGLFRADFRNLTLPGPTCPTRVRARVNDGAPSSSLSATATADMDGR